MGERVAYYRALTDIAAVRITRRRISASTVGRPSRRFGYLRCRGEFAIAAPPLSGRTMVATSVRIRRPSRAPSSARRRCSASDKRTRRPRNRLQDPTLHYQVLDDPLLIACDPPHESGEQMQQEHTWRSTESMPVDDFGQYGQTMTWNNGA
jgi:hypothetical protein